MAPFAIRSAQAGLTLIELMISITIGLIVVGAVTYLYIGSHGAYRGNESLARIQEAGRFALDSITRDIRRAGAMGCGSFVSPTSGSPITANVIAAPPGLAGAAVQGYMTWTAPTGAPGYLAGDVLQLQIASGVPARMSNNPDMAAGTITIADNSQSGFKANDYALLADCTSATLFKVIKVQTTTAPAALLYFATGAPIPQLTTGPSSFSVNTYPTVLHFDQVTYYLGAAPGNASNRALYRYSASTSAAEELAENIEDVEVTYGVGAGGSMAAGVFKHADLMTAGDWANVISVRVSVIGVGDLQGVAPAPQTLPFRGTTTAPDTRLRQVFTATAALRDRLQ
jgi:type IV pilus assembly protein PilW